MNTLNNLFENNRAWSAQRKTVDPDFFAKLAAQQSPEYLWIGCSDSRVPANEIVGLQPGEVFVHRNVANVVAHTDLNCLTVLQYAVEVLKVKHVIVVGHHGCGGLRAAYEDVDHGLADNWLRNIKDVLHHHQVARGRVRGGGHHVCQTTIVQRAWARGQQLSVHGWIYSLKDGLLQDLGCGVDDPDEVSSAYRVAP